MKDWELTKESLNLFLSWLSDDRDAAGKKYEDIRRRLIAILDHRTCIRSEEVADEAINRFIRRLPELIKTYEGDPLPYMLVIARNVQHEWVKKENLPLPKNLDGVFDPTKETDELGELAHDCLDECLSKFDSKTRDLLLDYYQNEKQEKINFRKKLAKQMGIAGSALRLRIHRLRNAVHSCMNDCLSTNLSL